MPHPHGSDAMRGGTRTLLRRLFAIPRTTKLPVRRAYERDDEQ
jgi:hypothetical protein